MVKITREQEGMDPGCGLRIAVRGGGCSGFEYAIDFEKEPRENDLVLEYDGLKVYVDPISGRFLAGHHHRLQPRHDRHRVQVPQPEGDRHLRLRLVVLGLAPAL